MEKNFDHILGEKLSRIKVEYDPESWSLLEQRLDAELAGTPDLDEQQLDEALFDKLHRLRTPYDGGHWQLMSARLDQEFSLARQILRYKVLELGLVALLLLAIVQYLPMGTSDYQPWSPATEEVLPAEEENTRDMVVPAAEQPPRPVAESLPTAAPGVASESASGVTDQSVLASEDAQRDPFTGRTARKSLQIEKLTPGIDLISGLQQISPLRTERLADVPVETRFSLEPDREEFLTAALAPLSPAPLRRDGLLEEAILDYRRTRKSTYFRVGMFGSADYYRVFTPEDEELELESLARMAAGYGGGLTFGLERGPWEVETGLIYAAKQYQARPIIKVNGSVKDGFLGWGVKDIEINIINIPLNLRYNFLRNEKWRMYALAGASIQVAVQANYYTATQEAFRSSSFAPAPATGRSNYGSFRTLADELPGGWFEGGSFEENGYLTGNVGLGLERYFSGQWSVFVQPTYQHSINYFLRGLGPTRDEINTLSLYTGIRLRLKK